MPDPSPHPATLEDDTLMAQCRFTATRRGGPGGQHRNKVATAIVLEHTPTGLTAQAAERRSQAQNRSAALFRLRLALAVHQRRPIAQPFTPSERWRIHCHQRRIHINPSHANLPALLAEALDVLAAADWDMPAAADQLQCTPTQLVKLLKLEPAALRFVNEKRRLLELAPLR